MAPGTFTRFSVPRRMRRIPPKFRMIMSSVMTAETPDETPERTGTDEGSLRPDEPDTDLLWFQAGDGSLVTLWEGRQYRAIPMAAWGLPMDRILERRVIEGVEYAVFATENGKSI